MTETFNDPTGMAQMVKQKMRERTLYDSTLHCPAILNAVNSLRQEGDLCDASLVIEHKKILVHKCVLVGGSDYFRSRFIGPLKGDNPEVDLSSVTSDADSLEAVVNYLYTGKITVDPDNLQAIMKISSYLLLTKLRQFCIKYMMEKVYLNKCLQYYLLAVEYDIKEVVDKLALTVKSRFHDSVIFEDSILSVSPDQLLFLIYELNIFEHCTVIDALTFVINWVESGLTEKHELLACDILDFVIERENNSVDNIHSYGYVKANIHKIQTKVEDINAGCQLRSRLKKAVKSCSDLLERFSFDPSEKDEVLIVLHSKQCLKELTADDAVFDICAYMPKKQIWCHMGNVVNQEFRSFESLAYSGWFPYVNCFVDRLCVVWPCLRNMRSMNFADLSWQDVELPNPDDLQRINDRCFVCTPDDTLYLIRPSWASRTYTHIYFRCYRLTSENTWVHVFDTPKMQSQGIMSKH